MITYYFCKEMLQCYRDETSLEDFMYTMLFLFALVFTIAMDIIFIIPEILYLGFKFIVRRIKKIWKY